MRERAMLEASLDQFEHEHLRRIGRTMAESELPQAQRIARKLIDYTGELDQIRSLQREIAKLQAAQANLILQTQHERELRAASEELRLILLDEEDTIQAILVFENMEARHMLSVLGITIN